MMSGTPPDVSILFCPRSVGSRAPRGGGGRSLLSVAVNVD